MNALLVVTGDGDPTAELLVEAAGSLGVPVDLVDLRSHRFSVRVGAHDSEVLSDSRILRPAVVVNTSSVNGLGLSGADGLLRQRSSRWQHRHAAAREEQGLVLSAFELLGHHGAVLVNGPRACDLALMPNAVVDRLVRGDIAVDLASEASAATDDDRVQGTDVLVSGGHGIAHTGATLPPSYLETALAVARAAEFQMGSVRIAPSRSGRQIVVGWSHRPDLSRWGSSNTCAIEIVRSFPALQPDQTSYAASAFFVDELGEA